MPEFELAVFLAFVAIGALVQAITGFALALIVMGGVTALGLAEISFSAAVVSLIALVNTSISLRRSYRFVDRKMVMSLITGLLPFTAIGVGLLEVLSTAFYEGLRLVLGVVIIVAGTILMVQPTPFASPSSRGAMVLTGATGGLTGGLYGAAGAPLAWLMYRQPIDFQVVRATLLATFFASTAGRTAVVIASGHMTTDILLMAGLSIPLVVIATVLGVRLAPRVPERILRRGVFVMLVLMGAFLIGEALMNPVISRGSL
ncbi:MAG: sulfite exporter TauE/SafE family protein [Gammaproteobacteria bacterium]|nr:sulfite exporter TauE/SafE family protein [Gammaproteobacteria bacterium]